MWENWWIMFYENEYFDFILNSLNVLIIYCGSFFFKEFGVDFFVDDLSFDVVFFG